MLTFALVVQVIFLIAQVAGGIIFNSLALLSDSAHMLTDVAALALALGAARIALLPPSSRRTYGFARGESLAAWINAVTLMGASVWIVYEAIHRLSHPQHVQGGGVMVVAFLGLLANLFTAWLLMRADRDNLNIKAAIAHTLVDALSSVGVLVAGLVVMLTGAVLADTAASLLIAALAFYGGWGIFRQSLDMLLDAAPENVDADAVARVIAAHPATTQVHDLHVWEIGPRRTAVSAHVLVQPWVPVDRAITGLSAMLERDLGISHVTLQVAPDRTRELHGVVRRMPTAQACAWAEQYVVRSEPSLPVDQVRAAIAQVAASLAGRPSASPVQVAARALRMLQRAA